MPETLEQTGCVAMHRANLLRRLPQATYTDRTSVLISQHHPLVLNILDGGIAKLLRLVARQTRGRPLGRSPWVGLLEHAIDLLKGQSFRLRDKEECKDERAGTEGAPDEEDLALEVSLVLTNHIWGDDCDDGVPEPVGRRRETDTARANRQWEDFADDYPCTANISNSFSS